MAVIKEVYTGVKNTVHTEAQKKRNAEKLAEAYKRSSELVKGVLYDLEGDGTTPLEFVYQEWPQDPVRLCNLVPGETIEIPRGMAENINKNAQVKGNSKLVDVSGSPLPAKPRQRYIFTPTFE